MFGLTLNNTLVSGSIWLGLAVASGCAGVAIYRRLDTYRRKRLSLPTRVDGHWFWGNAIQFSENAVAFFHDCEKKFGNIFYVRLFLEPLNVVMDVHALDDFKREKAFDFAPIQKQVNMNVFGFEMKDAKGTITQISHDFRGFNLMRNMWNYDQHIANGFAKVEASQSEGKPTSLHEFSRDTIWAAIFYSIFGSDQACPDQTKLQWNHVRCLDHFESFHHYFNLLWVGLPHRMFPQTLKDLDYLMNSQPHWTEFEDRTDAAQYMREHPKYMMENGQSENDVRGHNLVYLHVHYNSLRLMNWFIIFALQNPDAKSALTEEIDELCARKRQTGEVSVDGKIQFTAEDIESLKVLDSMFKETLRMVSGVFMVRQVNKNVSFKTSDNLEWNLKKGEKVAVYPPAIHMDPEIFEQPEAYKFDRFIDATFYKAGKEVRNPLVGFGTVCVGQKYGTLLSKWYALAAFARFDLNMIGKAPEVDVRFYGHEVLPPTHDVDITYEVRSTGAQVEFNIEAYESMFNESKQQDSNMKTAV